MKKLLIFTVLLSVVFANQLLAQTDSQYYADYIRNNSEGAVEFVLSKLKRYPIVAIGEDHWIADHTPFLCEVLWEASKNDDTRPKILALEFGNELDQRLANKITHYSEFMPDSVIKILQHAPDIYGNPYKEYFDVIKCVWEINQGLDFEKKISIQLLDPAGVQDYFDGIKTSKATDRDMSMYQKLRWNLVNGDKVLFYAGQAHTQRQIRGTLLKGTKYYYNFPSAGFLLKVSYPHQVYTIDLWSPLNMGSGYDINPETGKWYEKSYGKFDNVFAINGNVPCGFDIADSPWGNITMAEYYGLPGKEDAYNSPADDADPYTKNVLLSQLLDGIVFIKPSNEFKGATLINIYTPDFIETCKRRSKGNLTTPEEILKQIQEWHPILTFSNECQIGTSHR